LREASPENGRGLCAFLLTPALRSFENGKGEFAIFLVKLTISCYNEGGWDREGVRAWN
jgi:hypothetical protein